VQARLAQWLLARKNPRDSSSASSLAIDSEDLPTFRAAETPSTNRTATRPAAADSDVPPAIARFVAQDPSDTDAEKVSARSTTRGSTAHDPAARDSVACNSAPRDSAARPAARPRNRPASVVAAKPRSRSPITRSAIACRSPNFPAFVHSSTAGKPTTNFKTRQSKLDAPLISPPASKPNSQLTRQVVTCNALSKSKTRQGHQPSSSIPPRAPTKLSTEPESRDQLTRVGSPTMSSRIEDAQKASALDLR